MPNKVIEIPATELSQLPDYWWNQLLDGNLYYVRLARFPFYLEAPTLSTYLYRRAYRKGCKVSVKTFLLSASPGLYVQAYQDGQRLRGTWSSAQMAAAREAPEVPLIPTMVPLGPDGKPDPNWVAGMTDTPPTGRMLPHERDMVDPVYEAKKPGPFKVVTTVQPVPVLDRDDPNYSPRADPENAWIFAACTCDADSTSTFQHDAGCGVWQL